MLIILFKMKRFVLNYYFFLNVEISDVFAPLYTFLENLEQQRKHLPH